MWSSRAKHLFRQLFRRGTLDHDLDEEVASYYAIRSDQGRARVDSDGPAQVKFNVRESRMSAPIDTVAQDLVYAARALKKSPGFTFFAVFTIALGLGANAAIFSLVDGVLLKSIGYPEPERIVRLWEKPPRGTRNGIAGANYVDWARQATLFETIAASSGGTMSYSGGGEPKSLRVGTVTARYFDVFRAKAVLGRTFAPNEDTQGKEHVAVLTHRLWTNAFGADRSLVGRRVSTYLIGGFAALAMLLACAGIYGVLSFVTARRTQELGIRAALGATRGDLIRMVIGGGATPVLAGIVVGIGGAIALARYIQAMLFNTSPLDPWNLAAVSALFLAVALAACFVPAWRAAQVDPITALRQE